MICDRHRSGGTDRIIGFVRRVLSAVAERPRPRASQETAADDGQHDRRSCVHMLLYILSATRSEQGKELLEETARDNPHNEFGQLALDLLRLPG